jgi:hypothetical protein
MKRLFTVYGNCQAYAIAMQLMSNRYFSEIYEYAPFKACFASDQQTQELLIESLKHKIDLLITQELPKGWRDLVIWDVDYLASSLLKNDGVHIRYPEIYFRAFTPSLVYPKTFPRLKSCDYLDLIMLSLYYKRALNVNNFKACYLSPDFLSAEDLDCIFRHSLSSLQSREGGNLVPVSSCIISEKNNRNPFYTFNHPAGRILRGIACAISEILEVKFDSSTPDRELLSQVRLPTLKCVSNAYNWGGSIDIDVISINGRDYVLEEYIQNFLEDISHVSDIGAELFSQRQDPISKLCIDATDRMFN